MGTNVRDIRLLLLPLEDFPGEVVFVEVAGEYIERLLALENRFHDMSGIHPEIEYQYGLSCFKNETTMEYVCQLHLVSKLVYISGIPSMLHLYPPKYNRH